MSLRYLNSRLNPRICFGILLASTFLCCVAQSDASLFANRGVTERHGIIPWFRNHRPLRSMVGATLRVATGRPARASVAQGWAEPAPTSYVTYGSSAGSTGATASAGSYGASSGSTGTLSQSAGSVGSVNAFTTARLNVKKGSATDVDQFYAYLPTGGYPIATATVKDNEIKWIEVVPEMRHQKYATEFVTGLEDHYGHKLSITPSTLDGEGFVDSLKTAYAEPAPVAQAPPVAAPTRYIYRSGYDSWTAPESCPNCRRSFRTYWR